MISPETLPGVLEKIDRWSVNELQNNVNNVLPILTTSLNNVEQKSLALRSVQALLDRCLICVPITSLESDILQHALPAAKNLFSEALEVISLILHEGESISDGEMCETVKSLYHVCCGLLGSLKSALSFISSKCPLPAAQVPSLPCTILQILQTAFTHCHDSEKLHGNLHEYLMDLFKSCQMLLTCLESMLVSGLQFSYTSEDDEVLLINVLESLASVAKVSTTLGIQVQNCAWKTYVFFIEKYASCNELWHGSDVSSPIEMLASTTSKILTHVLDSSFNDMQLAIKTLAVLSFLVRVLTRLCRVFAGYLTDSCMPSVLHMLALLNRVSIPSSHYKEEKFKILKEAEKRVGVASVSLVSSLLHDRSFVMAFFVKMEGSLEPEPPLSWLLFGTSIAQALVSLDEETRRPWISNPKDHLLMYIFQLLGLCHADLCDRSTVHGIDQLGKPRQTRDLYQHVLVPVGTFVLLVPCQYFDIVERSLLTNIMDTNLWRALFAMDLWCMVARQGSPSLRASHVKFILELLSSLRPVPCSAAQVHLSALLCRLWPLVPLTEQQQLLEMFHPLQVPAAWDGVVLKALPRALSTSDVLRNAASETDSFLEEPLSLDKYNKMIKSFKAATVVMSNATSANCKERETTSLAAAVTLLWSYVCKTTMDSAQGKWLSQFLDVLNNITVHLIPVFNNSQLLQIMKKFRMIVKGEVIHYKLQLLRSLKMLAEKEFENTIEQQEIFSTLATIFEELINDENFVVKQNGLEIFEYFAHFTCHEEIVKNCLTRSKTTQELFAPYLKKIPVQPIMNTKGAHLSDYLKSQEEVPFDQLCKTVCEITSINNFLKSHSKKTEEKDSKSGTNVCMLDKGVSEIIQRLKKDVGFIKKFCEEHNLLKSEKGKLICEMNNVRQQINDLVFVLDH